MPLREGGDSFDWFFLAMADWQLGEKEQAQVSFRRGVQWMEKNLFLGEPPDLAYMISVWLGSFSCAASMWVGTGRFARASWPRN